MYERNGEADSLAHAAAHARQRVVLTFGQFHPLQGPGDCFAPLLRLGESVHSCEDANVLADCQFLIEGTLLRHVSDAAVDARSTRFA